jgi:hypothetical protein
MNNLVLQKLYSLVVWTFPDLPFFCVSYTKSAPLPHTPYSNFSAGKLASDWLDGNLEGGKEELQYYILATSEKGIHWVEEWRLCAAGSDKPPRRYQNCLTA